jgi:hypothetical protein
VELLKNFLRSFGNILKGSFELLEAFWKRIENKLKCFLNVLTKIWNQSIKFLKSSKLLENSVKFDEGFFDFCLNISESFQIFAGFSETNF